MATNDVADDRTAGQRPDSKPPRRGVLWYLRVSLTWALAFALIGLVLAHHIPLEYTGTAIFERRGDAADTTGGHDGVDSYASYKLSLFHDMKGETAVEAIVCRLGLTRGLPHNTEGELTEDGEAGKEELIQRIRDNIEVEWEVKSDFLDLVSVTVTDPDPNLAQQIPNELVRNYIENTRSRLQANLTASREFLGAMTERCRARLRELEADRLAFEAEYAPMPLDDPAQLVQRIEAAAKELADLHGQRQAAEVRLWAAEKRFQQLARSFPKQAKALGLGAAEPLTTPGSPEAGPDADSLAVTVLIDARADWELASQEVEDLLRAAERVARRLVKLQALEAEFGPKVQQRPEMNEKIEKEQAELARWQERLARVEAALAAETARRRTHLTVVQAAREQFLPSSPRLMPLLLWGSAGSLLAGLVAGSLSAVRRIVRRRKAPPPPPRGRLARIAGGVFVVILLIAIAVATSSLVLRFHHPLLYDEWQSGRLAFLWRCLVEGLAHLSALLS